MQRRPALDGLLRSAALAAVFLGFGGAAEAQSPKEQAEAKQLWTTGKRAIAGGRLDAAVEAFRAAEALHGKPQYKLDLARALVQDGELVESIELLNQVATTTEPNSNLAIAAAKKLLSEVEPRLPWIKITVKGPPKGDAVTTIDGERIDASGEVPFDPGSYTVAAEADGFERAEKSITLAEGAHEDVVLSLEPAGGDASVAEEIEEEEDDGGSSIVPPILAFAVGAAGIGVGTAFGIVAFGQTSDVEERCGGNVCPPEEQAALDEAKRSGTVSTVGFVIGAVGVSTGIILLLASDDGEEAGDEADAGIEPVIGPFQVGVRGRF
jgi:hypothetical protein